MAPPDRLFALNRRRIELLTIVIGALAALWAMTVWGSPYGIGVAAGSILSLVNYRWLKHGVTSLAMLSNAKTTSEERKHSKGVRVWFVGRYVLMLAVACVILFGFKLPVVAFLCGMLALATAILIEMISHLIWSARGA